MTARRLPAEWEPQSGIMLTWPHTASDWKPILTQVEPVFVEICRHTSRHEKVVIVCFDQNHRHAIHALLTNHPVNMANVVFAIANSNDSWARDHGAISVWDNKQLLLLDFQFNAWGGKYESSLDNAINSKLYQQGIFKADIEPVSFVLEGGSIESDGQGTLLTTQCLLQSTRNPGMNQHQIESMLADHLGVQRVLWLQHGELSGDDTDAHIDTLARFVSPTGIVYVKCENTRDEHFSNLQAMENELNQLRTVDNSAYQLFPLPLPDPVYNASGQRLPATYANFLIINNAVLLPVYQQNKDSLAIEVLKECFPDREIIPINCLPLVHQFGSLHCVTMQFPLGIL